MLNSGELEENFDNAEDCLNFISEFLKVKASVKFGTQMLSIFSEPNVSQKIDSGNWKISCLKAGQLIITNLKANYRHILIKSDMPIFTLENSKGKLLPFSAKSTLGKFLLIFF